jgi:hypothetical protein
MGSFVEFGWPDLNIRGKIYEDLPEEVIELARQELFLTNEIFLVLIAVGCRQWIKYGKSTNENGYIPKTKRRKRMNLIP